MSLAPFFAFEGYKLESLEGHPTVGEFNVSLERLDDKKAVCYLCDTELTTYRGKHRITVKDMPVFSCPVEIRLWRIKAHCPTCKKARAEKIDFLAKESPHLTRHYAWWLSRLAEIAPVSQVAKITEEAPQTLWRIDYTTLQKRLKNYKIPSVKRIAVDEVYARKKRNEGESRDDQFFTIIVDLESRKVIWVSDSRKKEALEDFFERIGNAGCQRIEVVAVDQHEEYARAVRKYCPQARIVWDRFHLMHNFLEAVNDTRKDILRKLPKKLRDKLSPVTRRFALLKRDCRRSPQERENIDEALQRNEDFAKLEIMKEKMFEFFEAQSEHDGKTVLMDLGKWIQQANFAPLASWWKHLMGGWEILRNYFADPVTTALSEGINNVVKSLKRRSFGFRNMEYFKLKIMSVCGYLNSRYMPDGGGLFIRGVSTATK